MDRRQSKNHQHKARHEGELDEEVFFEDTFSAGTRPEDIRHDPEFRKKYGAWLKRNNRKV
jgi:hypothetical protein